MCRIPPFAGTVDPPNLLRRGTKASASASTISLAECQRLSAQPVLLLALMDDNMIIQLGEFVYDFVHARFISRADRLSPWFALHHGEYRHDMLGTSWIDSRAMASLQEGALDRYS